MSVDDDLTQATSQSLSMGSSIVATLDTSSLSEVLPQKLHPALYNNFLSDAPMGQLNISNNSSNTTSGSEQKSSDICNKFSASCSVGGGVPGFPAFPHFWQGESSAGRPNNTNNFDKRRYGQKWKINNAKTKRQQRQISRKAVNVHGTTTKRVGTGKEIKKRLRVDRRRRRMEQIVKLQERRRRKRDMGDICKGVASIKCR